MTAFIFGTIIAPDMNVYALIPLVATIAYIPLLVTTIASRPWQKQHKLFIPFLAAAMMWSLTDFFLRGNFFPAYNFLLFKITVVMFTWMAVQFHCFSSLFFGPSERRWLPFAYASLAAVIILVMLGHIPEGITASGDKLYPQYGTKTIIIIAIPIITLVVRNVYVFRKRLKVLDNPVLYNQTVSLMIGIFVLLVFMLVSLLPWIREYPISHLGNMLNAFILSYAIIRHQLVDIRFVLQRMLIWISLGFVSVLSYILLVHVFSNLLNLRIDSASILITTAIVILVTLLVLKLRGLLSVAMSKAFHGQSYDYRQQLSDFTGKIHNVFTLRQQGGELLKLVTKAVGCKKACLLFLEPGSEDFTAQLVEPDGETNPLSSLRLEGNSPLVQYLQREQKPLTGENLAVLPEFRSLWNREREEIKSNEIQLFMPLISRGRLIGILASDKKQSGRYLLEDFSLLEQVTSRVAVSMEKEYLREQLRLREKELSIINRSSAIITSSLDIPITYDNFIKELKKVVDVSWAAIVLIEENDLYFLALSSEIGSAWQAGERIPVKGTATEWTATHRQSLIEPDLLQENRFNTAKYHLEQGVRSIIYVPLIAKDEVIGALVVASRNPNAYRQRHAKLLEELASQIAMSVENARLYAKAEEKARTDELTGLLNRRSLNELISSEISRHSRYGGIFSLILLDLDSFKALNDNYGHLAGDKVLKQVGSILKKAIRTADQAFRYGGDEFAILLPQTAMDAAYQVAERIRKRVAPELKTGFVPITASLGLASWPADGLGPNEVIAAADNALYHAKRSGGDQSYRASGAMLVSDDAMIDNKRSEDSEATSIIYALAATVDARDHYTGNHSKRVNEYAVAIAEALNLPPLEISRLSACAFLHDVGKIGISDEILNKPGKLTDEEWAAIKVHSQLGAAIVSHVRHLAPHVLGILHHHERFDGSGYPKGLKGEEIPLEARILAIADAFAAMTSKRNYSIVLSYEQAIEELKRGAGTQFDPNLVEIFLSVLKSTHAAATKETTR